MFNNAKLLWNNRKTIQIESEMMDKSLKSLILMSIEERTVVCRPIDGVLYPVPIPVTIDPEAR